MLFTDTKIEDNRKEFHELEKKMKSLDFDRWSWDYGKAIYDKKYCLGDDTYYLRIQGNVVNDKQLEHPNALLELQQPVFVEHFFPHGLDASVDVPESLLEEVHALLAQVKKALT